MQLHLKWCAIAQQKATSDAFCCCWETTVGNQRTTCSYRANTFLDSDKSFYTYKKANIEINIISGVLSALVYYPCFTFCRHFKSIFLNKNRFILKQLLLSNSLNPFHKTHARVCMPALILGWYFAKMYTSSTAGSIIPYLKVYHVENYVIHQAVPRGGT